MADSQCCVEYRTIEKVYSKLTLAVQDNLATLTAHLFAKFLISDENRYKLTSRGAESKHEAAAGLLSLVMHKIQLSPENYHVFVECLKEDQSLYREVLQELDSVYSKEKSSDTSKITGIEPKELRDVKANKCDQTMLSSPLSNTEKMNGRECTCKICSSDIGYNDSLPVVVHSGYTEPESSTNKGKHKTLSENMLRAETKRMDIIFSKLLNVLRMSMQRIPVEELRSTLLLLPAFRSSTHSTLHISAFEDHKKVLKNATTVNDIFMVIGDNCTFIKFDIIQYLVEQLGNEDDRASLTKYEEKFETYAKNRAIDCPSTCRSQASSKADMVIKIDSSFDHYSLRDLEDFHTKVCEILQISPYSLFLCCVNKGCVIVTYQIPTFIQQAVFPLSQRQESDFEHLGVIWITCGAYTFESTKTLPVEHTSGHCTTPKNSQNHTSFGPSVPSLKTHKESSNDDELKKVEHCEYLHVIYKTKNNKKGGTKKNSKKIHHQQKFWVVLRTEPSQTENYSNHGVNVIIEYYKKKEDWQRRHKCLVRGLLTTDLSVTIGAPILTKESTKYILHLAEKSFQLELAFDSAESMYSWCESLLLLTPTLLLDLVRCPEDPTREGQYLVQVSRSSVKLLSTKSNSFQWEWQWQHIRQVHWNQLHNKLELEISRNSETGEGHFSFTGHSVHLLFRVIKTQFAISEYKSTLQSQTSPQSPTSSEDMSSPRSPASPASPTSQGRDSEEEWTGSSVDSYYINHLRELHTCSTPSTEMEHDDSELHTPLMQGKTQCHENEYMQLSTLTRNQHTEYHTYALLPAEEDSSTSEL